jgi:DNA-binding NarL/FixJ family response regulator
LIVDHRAMVRVGLRSILQRERANEVVGEATDGHEVIELALSREPDVLIMERTTPLLNALEAAREILRRDPHIKIILTDAACDVRLACEAMRLGARGYLVEDSDVQEWQAALKAALNDSTYLSPRVRDLLTCDSAKHVSVRRAPGPGELTGKQREVLQLLASGRSNKQVAECLHVCCKTVEAHRARIMDKLQIRSLAGLTKYAIREGLTTLEL